MASVGLATTETERAAVDRKLFVQKVCEIGME